MTGGQESGQGPQTAGSGAGSGPTTGDGDISGGADAGGGPETGGGGTGELASAGAAPEGDTGGPASDAVAGPGGGPDGGGSGDGSASGAAGTSPPDSVDDGGEQGEGGGAGSGAGTGSADAAAPGTRPGQTIGDGSAAGPAARVGVDGPATAAVIDPEAPDAQDLEGRRVASGTSAPDRDPEILPVLDPTMPTPVDGDDVVVAQEGILFAAPGVPGTVVEFDLRFGPEQQDASEIPSQLFEPRQVRPAWIDRFLRP